ncbi:MAG TPA: hypothetical protein VIK52_14895 [Opitutaceae bacterium]
MLLKATAICIVIAAAETLHGIARVRFLNRRLGDKRARQVAVFSASAIILFIGWFTVPWIAPASRADCLSIGALWLALMLAFEFTLGRMVFRMPWRRIFADFDPTKGGLLAIGMLVLFATPWIIANWRALY